MVFSPAPCSTRWEGVVVTGWIILFDLLMLIWMVRRPIDWMKFGLIVLMVFSVPVIVHLAYRTWSAFTLEFWVDRNAITIRWATSSQIIPVADVRRIINGGVVNLGKPGILDWPIPYLGGTARALGILNITMLATLPLHECILLETKESAFALSPLDAEGFLATLQVRRELGPTTDVQPQAIRRSAWNRTFGADATGALLFGAGMAGVLLLFGLLMLGFQDLPEALAFHYNVDGQPDLVRGKEALFLLPVIGLLAWLVNGAWGLWMAFRGDRLGAYMLWGGAVIVQVFSFMALVSLMV
jgi:hypothetical protein